MSRRFEPVVLCYHAVSERWAHHLSVSPQSLERQVRLLLARGYRAVPAADVVAGRGRLLHVTFDDAFRSVLDAQPALERLGVPATVFACAGLADGGQPFPVSKLYGTPGATDLLTLNWDGLRGLVERGIEVGSHTVSHPHLTRLTDLELERELRESRERLESELGRRCRYLAYPDGDHDARVRAVARETGYEAAFALPGRAKPFDPFGIPRVGVWRKDGLARFALKTSATRRAIGFLRGWR
jgi:peptidoglycan/xylan/chitin deacetylase (PgdA/CDA1 family)